MSLITEEQPPSGTEDMLSEYLVRMFRDAATSDDISDQFHVRTALPEKPITGKLYYFKQIINTVIYREGFYWYDATTSTWRFLGVSDFYLDVARGLVPGHSLVHKFGAGQVPNGTFAAITYTGIYPTPTTAQSLEFVSDDAQDGVGGTGAREVTICGIDANWERITQTIPTNGIAAVAIPINFIRLCRWWVSSSGTYAATGSASQAGN
ncbi:MAG: hypothetical protein KAT90_15100, partial [Gammaproteobacteria bacterium]|nr:hypothetical protein [Gammaproteobacteria bacterium]